MPTDGVIPPARNGHTTTIVGNQRAYGRRGVPPIVAAHLACAVVLIGGWLGAGPFASQDVYVLTIGACHVAR